METILTPENINTLITNGQWQIGLALACVQFAVMAVAIPLVKHFAKQHSDQNKRIIDLERENTKLIRDAQIDKLDKRIDSLEIATRHNINELTYIINNVNKTVGEIHEKVFS